MLSDGRSSHSVEAGLSVYPNPAQNRTSLTFVPEQATTYQIAMYDVKGALVKMIATGQAPNSQALSFEIDASQYPAGMYMVKLVTGDKTITKRLIINP
ncbi:T9SS type A sorting domain-containing protein [Escherichia coli]|uniref:T9SS type A sorting domain-containing protein n=1 Tax=Escherichia coli TaxID=562 RepID=UPI003A598B37